MPVRQFIEYLGNVRRYSPHTIAAYRKDLLQFLSFCELDEDCDNFSHITTKKIRSWLMAEMRGDFRNVSPGKQLNATSGRRKLSSVKAFFRFLVRSGMLEENPAVDVSGPKVPKILPVFISEEQADRVLDDPGKTKSDDARKTFSYLRDRLILLMLYETGMRRSEIVGLKTADVDFSRRCIRVTGKGNKQREIPVIPELTEDMRLYLEVRGGMVKEEHGLFFVTDKGRPVYDKFVYRLTQEVLGKYTSLAKKSPHVLRHTFATHLLNNGATIQGIRELLGHSSLAATQVYTHNSIERLLEVFKQAHPRAE